MCENDSLYALLCKKSVAFYRIQGDVMEVVRVMYLGSNSMKRLFGE
jgi:hypothetical protein